MCFLQGKKQQKAHGVCCPERGTAVRRKSFFPYFLCLTKSMEKVAARTCKKLPVASFCASETAETGRIANGREQGDHVSRRQSGKGFNFVRGKVLFGCAASRLGKPRSSRQGSTDWYFLRRAKSTAKTRRGLRPSGLLGAIQFSARYVISAEITGHHHVTGRAGYFNLPGYRR